MNAFRSMSEISRSMSYIDTVGRTGWITFARPAYLAKHGVPRSMDDLGGHRMIGFVSSATRAMTPLEFQTDRGVRILTLPASVTVTAAATYACLAKLGMGLIQVPRYRVVHELEHGELAEVLAAMPPQPSPVYLLYPKGCHPSPRVRLFIDWAAQEISARLAQA